MQLMRSAAAFFALFSAASAATAADHVVVNGGFEVGDFAGWSVNDPSIGTFVARAFSGYGPHDGEYFVALGANGQLAMISQNLHTTAGTTYTRHYFLASDGAVPNEFEVLWDGTTLADQVNIPAQAYVEYTFRVTATSTLTNLRFLERDQLGFLSLDNVAVIAAAPVSVGAPSDLGGRVLAAVRKGGEGLRGYRPGAGATRSPPTRAPCSARPMEPTVGS